MLDLGKMVAEIHGFLLGPQPNLSPTSQQQLLPSPPPLPAWIAGLRPVVPTAATLQLTERKVIARASACQVFAAVWLQAAARGLLARRRLQKMRSPMHEATLAAVDLSIGERDLAWSIDLAWSDGHQQPRQTAVVFRRKHGVFSVGGELQLCGIGDMGAAFLLVTGGDALPSAIAFRHEHVSAGCCCH